MDSKLLVQSNEYFLFEQALLSRMKLPVCTFNFFLIASYSQLDSASFAFSRRRSSVFREFFQKSGQTGAIEPGRRSQAKTDVTIVKILSSRRDWLGASLLDIYFVVIKVVDCDFNCTPH